MWLPTAKVGEMPADPLPFRATLLASVVDVVLSKNVTEPLGIAILGELAATVAVIVFDCPYTMLLVRDTEVVVLAGLTVMVAEVPVIVFVTVSVAVMVSLAAVFSVAENVPTPLVNVELAGSVAVPSVLVK